MLIHWIWLASRPNLSDRMKTALMDHFSDAEELYFADIQSVERFEYLTKEAIESLQDKNLKEAQNILDTCMDRDIHILTFRDAAYPARLRNIPDAPMVLYYKGRLIDFDGLPLIGIVGTRHATAYGITVAKRMGYQIAVCGGVVVSGMAFGIDGVAMSGALTAGMPVVGVLGCGVDIVYPPSNKALFADTVKSGCILSEFPPGTPPYGWNFPKRNRIISGISCGVLVVEAPQKSGALITAHQALEQGRDVFVVPGNIDVDTCKGSNALLRDGAIAATSGWDVVGEYEAQFPDKIHKVNPPAMQQSYPDEVQQPRVAQKPKLIERIHKEKLNKQKPAEQVEESLPALSAQEERIVALMNEGNTLVDDIIAHMQQPAASVLAALTMLQIKGVVKSLPGKRVELLKGKK